MSSGKLAALEGSVPADQLQKIQVELRDNIAKGLAEAEKATGLRLDRDVDSAAIALGGFDQKEPLVAVVALGRFDAARITAAVEASQQGTGATPAHHDVEGAPLLAWEKAGKPHFAMSIETRSVIFGSPALVERAVANRVKRLNALAAAPRLQGLVKALRPDAGLWVAADEALLDKAKPAPGAPPPPFPVPSAVTFTAQWDGGLELVAEMADETAARNLADVVRGGIGMARMQAAQPPAASAAAQQQQQQKALMDLLSSIEVQQQARSVKLTSSAAGGGSAGLGVVAAIAIPSLLRARVSANEAATIGDIRTVISAQAAYAATNGGAYGELRCLADPKACKPGYAGASFIDATLGALTDKSGYKRAFFPGKPSKPGAKSYAAFAYTATPVEPGSTGVRSFCGDGSGVVCADPNGAAIQPVGGACPAACKPLQ
jgi:type II secretory pathway pseudopilin PulG